MRWLVLMLVTGLPGGERGMPFWVEVEPDCRTVAEVASAWLSARRVTVREMARPDASAAIILRLESDKVRDAAGKRILFPERRYALGGRWFSFLMDIPVRGWRGQMTLRSRDGGGCLLSMQVAYRTMWADYLEVCTSLGCCEAVYSSTGPDGEGPPVPSNGRLEREYVEAIFEAPPRR